MAAKWKLINKKTGKESGIIDDSQKSITQNHPHTRGKYIYEPVEEPEKPAGVSKKADKKEAKDSK